MPELDVIRKIAQRVLVVSTDTGVVDNWLWDQALRYQKNVNAICRLPELAGQANSIDRFCLVIAAFFVNSGYLKYRSSAKTEINDTQLYKLSTGLVHDNLVETLSRERIDVVNDIIVGSCDRFTEITEAMILSDARSLDDLGTVGLLNELRHQMNDGKGVSDITKIWKRKVDYGYWQARLQESFRFDAVARLAQKRFLEVERFMNQLTIENQAADLGEQLGQLLQNT